MLCTAMFVSVTASADLRDRDWSARLHKVQKRHGDQTETESFASCTIASLTWEFEGCWRSHVAIKAASSWLFVSIISIWLLPRTPLSVR